MSEASKESQPLQSQSDESGSDDDDEIDEVALQQAKRCNPRWTNLLECVIGPVIITNLGFVCYETDIGASDALDEPSYLVMVNRLFLGIYMFELTVHLHVERCQFWKSQWNLFDAFIVGTGIFGEVMDLLDAEGGPQLSVLRVFRVMRMLRVVRLFNKYKELWLLVRNLVSAMRTLFWSGILFSIMLTIWSILAVEYIHPAMINVETEECQFCSVAFSSVLRADFTFFQIMSGDDWGYLANTVIETHPYVALIFVPMVFTMVFGMINLVSAVMVENAAQARQDDITHMVKLKEKEMRKAKATLENVFASLDTRGNGELTLEELMKGMKNNSHFKQLLQIMHVKPQELRFLFDIMDEDHSGSVTAAEFAEKLHQIKTQETKTTLMFLWHHVSDVSRKQDEHLSLLRSVLEEQQQRRSLLQQKDSRSGLASPTRSQDNKCFRKSVSWNFDRLAETVDVQHPSLANGSSPRANGTKVEKQEPARAAAQPSRDPPQPASGPAAETGSQAAAFVPPQTMLEDPAEKLMAMPSTAAATPATQGDPEWAPDMFSNYEATKRFSRMQQPTK